MPKSLILPGVALLILALMQAPTVNAQTNQSLQAQINALLAQLASLQAQLGQGSAYVTFTRDITIGSTGADVTSLQNWLIMKGHAIPAGATGYFGAQTRAALAGYQAANGISPAAGYFGAITRARVNQAVVVPAPAPTPTPTPDNNDNDRSEREDAEDAIEAVRDDLSDAHNEVEEADEDGDDIGDAEDLLDEAEDLIRDAEGAYDDRDYDEVMDLVDEAEDLIDEALDEIDSDSNNNSGANNVDSSTSRNENGDVGTFSFEFTIKATRGDIELAEDDFDYEVVGPANNGITTNLSRLSGDADESGGTYTIEEGDSATFSFEVTVTVDSSSENGNYRVHLDNIRGQGVDETSGALLLTDA